MNRPSAGWRRQRGCSASRMQLAFHHGLLDDRTIGLTDAEGQAVRVSARIGIFARDTHPPLRDVTAFDSCPVVRPRPPSIPMYRPVSRRCHDGGAPPARDSFDPDTPGVHALDTSSASAIISTVSGAPMPPPAVPVYRVGYAVPVNRYSPRTCESERQRPPANGPKGFRPLTEGGTHLPSGLRGQGDPAAPPPPMTVAEATRPRCCCCLSSPHLA